MTYCVNLTFTKRAPRANLTTNLAPLVLLTSGKMVDLLCVILIELTGYIEEKVRFDIGLSKED